MNLNDVFRTAFRVRAGCDYVWLQQDLGGTRQVEALRYTFRPSAEQLTLSDAAVFVNP